MPTLAEKLTELSATCRYRGGRSDELCGSPTTHRAFIHPWLPPTPLCSCHAACWRTVCLKNGWPPQEVRVEAFIPE